MGLQDLVESYRSFVREVNDMHAGYREARYVALQTRLHIDQYFGVPPDIASKLTIAVHATTYSLILESVRTESANAAEVGFALYMMTHRKDKAVMEAACKLTLGRFNSLLSKPL